MFFIFPQVDAKKTLNENIADSIGTYLAYTIIENSHRLISLPNLRNYSLEQYFWLSYASRFCHKRRGSLSYKIEKTSKHAPNYFRVNSVMASIFGFGTKLACPLGTEMYPGGSCNYLQPKRNYKP